jgi:hypothetical protein
MAAQLFSRDLGSSKGSAFSGSVAFEAIGEPAGVDVESVQNSQDGFNRNLPFNRPLDDIEILFSDFQAIEDAIEETGVFVEFAFQESKVAAVEFEPVTSSLQMFNPAGSQITAPMMSHPTPNRLFA